MVRCVLTVRKFPGGRRVVWFFLQKQPGAVPKQPGWEKGTPAPLLDSNLIQRAV